MILKVESAHRQDNSEGTEHIPVRKIEQVIRQEFDLRPYSIIKMLDLIKPIYLPLAAYGHMGRIPEKKTLTFTSPMGETISHEIETFTWEKLDYVDTIKNKFNI